MVFDGEGRLFLQNRAETKSVEAGKWDTSCAGHCRPGEGFETAAKREMAEELGVAPGWLRPFWRRISGTAFETELCQTYLTHSEGPFSLEADAISQGRFWSREEILGALGQGVFTPHLEEEARRFFLGCAWPKALAVDLDGTALDSRKRLAPETVAALTEARRRGVRLFVATARPPRSARPYIEALRLDEPVIYYNGALVATPDGREALHHQPLDADTARAAVRALRGLDPRVEISFESLDRWFTDRLPTAFLTETAAQFQPDAVGELESFLRQPVTKILASWQAGDVGPLAERLEALLPGRTVAWPTDGRRLLQIMSPAAGKEIALGGLLAEAGLDGGDLLAVGDDMNDMEMLSLAGRSVAMANAPHALKLACDDVTASNDRLGLAKSVEKYILSLLPTQREGQRAR